MDDASVQGQGNGEWSNVCTESIPLDVRLFIQTNTHTQSSAQCLKALGSTIQHYWDEHSYGGFPLWNRDYWEDTRCKDLLRRVPWLENFTRGKGDNSATLSALSTAPNPCTQLILRLDVLLANTIIMREWKVRVAKMVKNWIRDNSALLCEDSGTAIARAIEWQAESKNLKFLSPIWKELQACVVFCLREEEYQSFTFKVGNFCLVAGCPAVSYHPRDDIFAVRQYLNKHDFAIREAELRAELDKLRNENRVQQRMITNLAFRGLLEKLPPPAGTGSATSSWTKFFKGALTKASAQKAQANNNHPLAHLLDKYDRLNQIETVGTSLYGTLSTNIHHFTAQFAVSDDQWNTLEADILKALIPLPQNTTQAGTDWSKERTRY